MAGGEAAGPGSASGPEKAEAGEAGLEWVEALRGECEAEHHWRHRREFLLRNAEALPAPLGGEDGHDSPELRGLVSFSMVWANHVFLGCRYPSQVMEKVLEMAAGITVTNAPTHTLRDELVAKVKRGISSSNEGVEEPCKKRAVDTDKASEVSRSDAKSTKAEMSMETDSEPLKSLGKEAENNPEKPQSLAVAQKVASSAVAQKVAPAAPAAVAQKVAPAAVAQKVAPAAVAQKVAPAAVAQKVAPAAVAQKVAPAAVAQKVAPAAVAQKVAPAAVAQKVAPAAVAQKVAPAAVAQKVAPAAVAQKVAPAAVAQKVAPAATSAVAQKVAMSSDDVKIESRVGNYESTRHKSAFASLLGPESKQNYCLARSTDSKRENALPSEKKVNLEGVAVLASKSSSHMSAVPAKVPCKLLTNEDVKERQPFFNRLYKAVAWKLVAAGGFSPNINHVELLNSSILSVKATLDVDFVPLKELTDLPQNKSSQESIVCELRCKSVYLGTGCGKNKENAKAVASREALKLFLKKKVVVKLCKRKYKGREIEDLVLLDEESKPLNLPPALRNPQEIL